MKRLHALGRTVIIASAMIFSMAGCGESDGPAEKAGKAVDEAIQKGTDSVSDVMKGTEEAITGAAEDAKGAMSDAMDSTGDALKGAAEGAGEAMEGAKDAGKEAVGLKD